jgi:hypothetical protein
VLRPHNILEGFAMKHHSKSRLYYSTGLGVVFSRLEHFCIVERTPVTNFMFYFIFCNLLATSCSGGISSATVCADRTLAQ